MKLTITGATGYIGARVVTLALERGHTVLAATRRKPDNADASWVPYDLFDRSSADCLSGAHAVIHLAASTSSTGDVDEEAELMAAKDLLERAGNASAKFILVSSQTAGPDAPTAYGRSKWRIEREVLATGGWVVRPGQVYGRQARGLFGTLVKAVEILPVLPAFLPAPKVQPVHVDDLAEGLLRIAERDDLQPGVRCLGSLEPITFTAFLSAIARHRVRRRRLFIPIPISLVTFIAAVVGRHRQARWGLERLHSLFKLPPMQTAADLEELGSALRPLHAGMHPSGDDRRRRLLIEARVLLGYLLRERPPSTLCRRYARGVERLQGGKPLALPDWLRCWPGGLALLDGPDFRRPEAAGRLEWRLEAATLLAESSPIGARRFLLINGWQGPLPALLRILRALAGEGAVRLARLPLGFWLRALRTRVQEETR